ncbi:hypothetical protein V8F33_005813 [Rhypophila sp. PSN 637]
MRGSKPNGATQTPTITNHIVRLQRPSKIQSRSHRTSGRRGSDLEETYHVVPLVAYQDERGHKTTLLAKGPCPRQAQRDNLAMSPGFCARRDPHAEGTTRNITSLSLFHHDWQGLDNTMLRWMDESEPRPKGPLTVLTPGLQLARGDATGINPHVLACPQAMISNPAFMGRVRTVMRQIHKTRNVNGWRARPCDIFGMPWATTATPPVEVNLTGRR